jgi:hypothetical protein
MKASMLFEVERLALDEQTTTLIAAIRGSKGRTDWLVNCNTEMVSCPDIIVSTNA